MFYIKLDSDMNLVVTVREALYRGDHLNQKITYLIPQQVGDIDIENSTLYLSYIRADGTADIVLLRRMEELYNETYYQFTFPVTCTLTRYAGSVCTWLQIYSGPASHPIIAKSGECILQIIGSKNMDEYISDRNLSLIYEMQKQMEDKIQKTGEELGTRIDETNAALEETNLALEEGLAGKADNVVFDVNSSTLQLMSGEEPVGDAILIELKDASIRVIGASINEAGELILEMSDGTFMNLGTVKGKDGGVYVPNYDAHKVLTFTYQAAPEEGGAPIEIPPIDFNPNDEWSDIGDGDEEDKDAIVTDFIWESI